MSKLELNSLVSAIPGACKLHVKYRVDQIFYLFIFYPPLFALQLQICSSGHAVSGVTRCHHQVHHRLHLWNLFRFNELHDAQFALLKQKIINGCTNRRDMFL